MKNEYVHVYSANGQLAGEMIRLFLESVNIPAIISQESAGSTYGLTVGPLGEVKIYVPAAQAEEARQVLRAMEDGKLSDENLSDPSLTHDFPVYKHNKMPPSEVIKEGG